MSNSNQYYGIAPPISTLTPQPAEIEAFNKLDRYLRERNDIYELENDLLKRNLIINQLNEILVDWSMAIGIEKQIPNENIVNGGGIQVHIFGSTSLGVNTPDADIDALCIAPYYITRIDFFTSFVNRLLNLSEITMLSSIPEAYTPVIKFNLNGLAIDMIFASLTNIPYIPNDIDLLDNKYLVGLDEQSIRSLNGVRVAKQLVKLIPNYINFQIALRAIKHWARQRSIYSNVLGFLGGINYAILVAYVCQNYPNANPATLIRKFFYIYSNWNWKNPILLNNIDDNLYIDNIYVWNPKKNIKDSLHIMPIITPTYPAMNSSYNVTFPQFRIIKEEILRGENLFNSYDIESFSWNELFISVGYEYFQHYLHYVQIDITALTPDDHRKWFGWVESRLRLLIQALEVPPYLYSYPQANCYHRQLQLNKLDGQVDSDSNTDISTIKNPLDSNEISTPVKSVSIPIETLYISTFFIGLKLMNELYDVRSITQDFIYRVKVWPSYKPTMDILINPINYSNIPDFIYDMKAEPSNVNNCTPKKINPSNSISTISSLTSATNTNTYNKHRNSNNNSISSNVSSNANSLNNNISNRRNVEITNHYDKVHQPLHKHQHSKYNKVKSIAYHNNSDQYIERLVVNNNPNSTENHIYINDNTNQEEINDLNQTHYISNDMTNYPTNIVNSYVTYQPSSYTMSPIMYSITPMMVSNSQNIVVPVNLSNKLNVLPTNQIISTNFNVINQSANQQTVNNLTSQSTTLQPSNNQTTIEEINQTNTQQQPQSLTPSKLVIEESKNQPETQPQVTPRQKRIDNRYLSQIGKHIHKQVNLNKTTDRQCDRQIISKSYESTTEHNKTASNHTYTKSSNYTSNSNAGNSSNSNNQSGSHNTTTSLNTSNNTAGNATGNTTGNTTSHTSNNTSNSTSNNNSSKIRNHTNNNNNQSNRSVDHKTTNHDSPNKKHRKSANKS